MRLYVMPTDRPCIENACSYLPEIVHVDEQEGGRTAFLVLGDGTAEVDDANRRSLKEHPRARGLHYVAKAEMDRWLAGLVAKLPERTGGRLADILGTGVKKHSYGVILDRLFLLAASLGASTLHRRDSDTLLPASSDPGTFPYAAEVRFLGRRYSEFPELAYASDAPIQMVGSSYLGDWAGDFSRLYDRDPMLLYRQVALNYPGRPRDEVMKLAEKRFVGGSTTPDAAPRVVFDRLVELGNCSFSGIFRELPVSPLCAATATDYLLHDLLFLHRTPPVYHPHRVMHRHTDERRSPSRVVNYHLSSARYKVYNFYMQQVLSGLRHDPAFTTAGELRERIASVLSGARASDVDYIFDELEAIYRESRIEDFVPVADALADRRAELVRDVLASYQDHAELLAAWPELVALASQDPLRPELR